MANLRKRKDSSSKKEDEGSSSRSSPEESIEGSNRRKRAKASKPKSEMEIFPERRNLEDLWKAVFLVGTEWENMDKLHQINWNFSNLERTFEEGGELHNKKVYLFGCTESQWLVVNGEGKVVHIPIVVAVVSPIPPSEKIGINSVQRAKEEIVPMKAMKMAWVPYILLKYGEHPKDYIVLIRILSHNSDYGAFIYIYRHSQVERYKTQIFIMGCTQRRSALKLLKEEHIRKYDYCLPYLQPLKPDEDEKNTVVSIMYPYEPPVLCDFDYAMDELEEFTDNLINGEILPQDQKETFKEFVKDQVRESKKTQRQEREARQKAIEDMGPETRSTLENMVIYKFYPAPTPETPDITQKCSFINRYYGKAHVQL